MPIPEPVFDSRSYRDILNEALARIPVHNPEWTNFNDSDPGITLLQLFAFMSESIIYRANRIPERNRLKYLRLLGVPLRAASAACGLVVFSNPRGELKPLNRPLIDNEEMVDLLIPMMDERNLVIFEEEGGADFSHTIHVDGTRWRFRVNMLKSLGSIGLVARRINNQIPDFRGLFLPPTLETLCHFDQGMVLLAGVTGSGPALLTT